MPMVSLVVVKALTAIECSSPLLDTLVAIIGHPLARVPSQQSSGIRPDGSAVCSANPDQQEDSCEKETRYTYIYGPDAQASVSRG